jgi:hypothetical protein
MWEERDALRPTFNLQRGLLFLCYAAERVNSPALVSHPPRRKYEPGEKNRRKPGGANVSGDSHPADVLPSLRTYGIKGDNLDL